MPDNSEPVQDLVCRTIAVTPSVMVEIRVPLATALEWCPDLHGYPGLLRAAADGQAVRRMREALYEQGLGDGRWRATFPGGDAVEIVAAT
jgi:hypothetical protein